MSHIIKRPSPLFKDEYIYQAVYQRPDGSEINRSDWTDCFEDALNFLLDRGIKERTIKTTTEEVTQHGI
jgi:hypothetical protein